MYVIEARGKSAKGNTGMRGTIISQCVMGCGKAPLLNGCTYCKSWKGLGEVCEDSMFDDGTGACFRQVGCWTCRAFRQIGSE